MTRVRCTGGRERSIVCLCPVYFPLVYVSVSASVQMEMFIYTSAWKRINGCIYIGVCKSVNV